MMGPRTESPTVDEPAMASPLVDVRPRPVKHKKEGDLHGEGWGCYRVKKKEERVLGTQKEKKG